MASFKALIWLYVGLAVVVANGFALETAGEFGPFIFLAEIPLIIWCTFNFVHHGRPW